MVEWPERVFVGNGVDRRRVANAITILHSCSYQKNNLQAKGIVSSSISSLGVYVGGKRDVSIRFILELSPSKFRLRSFVDFGAPSMFTNLSRRLSVI